MDCICVTCSGKWGVWYISSIVNYIKKRPSLMTELSPPNKKQTFTAKYENLFLLVKGEKSATSDKNLNLTVLPNIIHTGVRFPCVDLRPPRASSQNARVCEISLQAVNAQLLGRCSKLKKLLNRWNTEVSGQANNSTWKNPSCELKSSTLDFKGNFAKVKAIEICLWYEQFIILIQFSQPSIYLCW